ncbi:MAG: hypothetical protein K2W85_12065 [Phycisphaerales bacterium]|nr:hypothetical protein [Phycisphaerales bacterium]
MHRIRTRLTGPSPSPLGCSCIIVLALTASLRAQAPGDLLVGSRGFGSIYLPSSNNPLPHDLLSGLDLLNAQIRGTGPQFSCPNGHLSLLALPDGRILARAGEWSTFGVYTVNPATGDRSIIPGTDQPLWASTSDMILWDPSSVLVVADDFVGGLVQHQDDPKILRLDLATNAATVVTSSTVGDGVIMHRPRAIAKLDSSTFAVVEVGPISASSLSGALLFRINAATGERTVLSSLSDGPTPRRKRVNGIIQPPALVPQVGSGPTFVEGLRGVAFLGGRLFVAGSSFGLNGYKGGIIEVDLTTGDRTLLVGSAILAGSTVSVPPGPGSDSAFPTSPTALQPRSSRTLAFCSTFGPNKVWSIDIDSKKLTAIADLQPRLGPNFQDPFFTALAVRPLDCTSGSGSTLQITQQPSSGMACTLLPLVLSVAATATAPHPASAAISYQWQYACNPAGPWSPISDGVQNGPCAFFSAVGSTQPSVMISSVSPNSATLHVRCVVTTLCLSAFSTSAIFSGQVCPVDINCSGAPDFTDLFQFLNLWFDGSPFADFDMDSTIQFQDIFAFLNAWFLGC